MQNTTQEFKVGDKVKYKEGEDFSCNGHQEDKEYIVSEVHHSWQGAKYTLIRFKGEDKGCYSYRLEHWQPEPEKHIHHDLIVAWAKDPKGCIIQWYDPSLVKWLSCNENTPSWSDELTYRIKPKTKEVTRWKWAMKSATGNYFVTNAYYTEEEANIHFDNPLQKIEDSKVTASEEV
jgi:hypothetical protein